jgi:hypothetical protein
MKACGFNCYLTFMLLVITFLSCHLDNQNPETVPHEGKYKQDTFSSDKSVKILIKYPSTIQGKFALQNYFFDKYHNITAWLPSEQSKLNEFIIDLQPPYTIGLYRIINSAFPQSEIEFIINGSDDLIEILIDQIDFKLTSTAITPSLEGNCLKSIAQLYRGFLETKEGLKDQLKQVSVIDPRYYSKKDSLRKVSELNQLQFFLQIDSLTPECDLTYAYNVVGRYLRKLSRYEKKEWLQSYQTEPSFMHVQYWNLLENIQLPDAGHPILVQQLSEYLSDYGGENATELAHAVDRVMSKVTDEHLKRSISEWMVYYFLHRNIETLAEQVALKYIEGCDESEFNRMKRAVGRNNGPELYSIFPNSAFTLEQRGEVDLHKFIESAQITMIYFWKHDCNACLDLLKTLKSIRQHDASAQVQIIGIHLVDNKDVFKGYVKTNDIDWLMIQPDTPDEWEQLMRYEIHHTPRVFVVQNDEKCTSHNERNL